MGIESDQLVLDYLSRVGDLAQQRQLPSGDRMRLVAELRGEIDRRRGKAMGDGPAAVRRILARLGSPHEVVTRAVGRTGDGGGGAGSAAGAEVGGGVRPDAGGVASRSGGGPDVRGAEPAPASGESDGGIKPSVPLGPGHTDARRPRGLLRKLPRPRPAAAADAPAAPVPDGPAPPHLAGADELGPRESQPDWWRTDPGPLGGTDRVPGFSGGVEIPELLRPPSTGKGDPLGRGPFDKDARAQGKAAEPPAAGDPAAPAAPATKARRRWLPLPRAEGRARPWTNPLLLLAAALLVAGAVLGNWFALGIGWVIAYASRRLTVAESKWAVLGMPGLVVAGGIVWLWGRMARQWGEAIPEGHMNDALAETWPWVVRCAAIASALFLVWRSQRGRS